VSRVTIGSPIVSEITRRKMARRLAKSARTTREVSRVGTRSFRLHSATPREPKRRTATSALVVDDTMNKLTSLTPKLPYATRKLCALNLAGTMPDLASSFHF
jgi:hypothetical protein